MTTLTSPLIETAAIQAAADIILPGWKDLLLVVAIMALALGGTVGILKLIKKIFPKSTRIVERGQKWADEHKNIDI